jgi:hypothetical protein
MSAGVPTAPTAVSECWEAHELRGRRRRKKENIRE